MADLHQEAHQVDLSFCRACSTELRLRSLCWDPTRQRLALAAARHTSDGSAEGLVAVLATLPAALLSGSLRLIGCMHDPWATTSMEDDGSADGATDADHSPAVSPTAAKQGTKAVGGARFAGASCGTEAGLLLAVRLGQQQVRLVPLVV